MNSLIRRHLRARRGLQLLVKDISFSSVAKLGAAIHCVSVNSGLGGASGLGRHSAAYKRSGTMRDMSARPGIHCLTLKTCSGRLIRAGAAMNCLSLLVTKCGKRCMLSASRPLEVLQALPRAPLLCRPRRRRISGEILGEKCPAECSVGAPLRGLEEQQPLHDILGRQSQGAGSAVCSPQT